MKWLLTLFADAKRYRAIKMNESPFVVWDGRFPENRGLIYTPRLDAWVDEWIKRFRTKGY